MILVAGKETRFCSRGGRCPALSCHPATTWVLGRNLTRSWYLQLKNAGAWVSPPGILILSVPNGACRGLRHAVGSQEATGDRLVGFLVWGPITEWMTVSVLIQTDFGYIRADSLPNCCIVSEDRISLPQPVPSPSYKEASEPDSFLQMKV